MLATCLSVTMDQNELNKAAEMKKRLDQISPTFCAVRWKHATINLGSGTVKSCCHLPFQKIEKNNLNEGYQLHDTLADRKERQMMLEGKRPADCSVCWWVEDSGHYSDRITWSSKSWMSPYVDELSQKQTDKAEAPSWVELNFSNLCNLKCMYCSPIFSTSWEQEIKKFGPYLTHENYNDLQYLAGIAHDQEAEELVNEKNFWAWFEQVYPSLRLLKVTGGEPFLNKNLLRVLEYVAANPNPNLSFSINTNLSIPENIWAPALQLISKIIRMKNVANFYLHPSLDTYGHRAEYIRYGLDFSLLKKHVREFLETTGGNVIFICTLNNLALTSLTDFWRYLLSLKRHFGSNKQWVSVTSEVLILPAWQNINILPTQFQNYLKDTISFVKSNLGNDLLHFSEFELQGLERALDIMKKPNEKLDLEKSNFYKFFSEYDRRRNTNLLECFPEMANFWDECKELALIKFPQPM